MEERQIETYIATGREPHHQSWQERFAAEPEPPAEDASPQIKMAYKLRTEIGQAIYRLRKCTVEPVIGIIKAVLGFRQFSLRGLQPGRLRMALGLFGLQSEAPTDVAWVATAAEGLPNGCPTTPQCCGTPQIDATGRADTA